jgi:hypothetical protein
VLGTPQFTCFSCAYKSTNTDAGGAAARDGDINLYFNRSNPKVDQYIDDLFQAFSQYDATCGGLPYYASSTLEMSYGKKCTADSECLPPLLNPCTPGVDCFCCANVSLVCSSSADCSRWAPHATCGCQKSNPTDARLALVASCGNGTGQKPCFCCNNLKVSCTTPAQCGAEVVGIGKELGNVSYCGCRPDEGICGPFGQGPIGSRYGNADLMIGLPKEQLSGGTPCLYVGAKSTKCIPAVYLTEGTAEPDFIMQMQMAGSSVIEFYGPPVQAFNGMKNSFYNTSNPKYPFYNKRYRTPLNDRDASFNVLEDDEDVITLTVMDMGNTGGTKRRCMLCPQHCLCREDCTECTDCGRLYRAGCYDRGSFVISVIAVNDPPSLTGPDEIWAVEGMPYSFVSTSSYRDVGSILQFVQGPSSLTVGKQEWDPVNPFLVSALGQLNMPDERRRQSEMMCYKVIGAGEEQPKNCSNVWKEAKPGYNNHTMQLNGISITDPDTKDYGYDAKILQLKLSCTHGRLFVNERFLHMIMFNGDFDCNFAFRPEESEKGCRLRLVKTEDPQGEVGLYTRIIGSNEEPASCVALGKFELLKQYDDNANIILVEKFGPSETRRVPTKEVTPTTRSWGCPCHSNVEFDDIGRSYDRDQPESKRYKHCSASILFNQKMPLSTGQSLPLVGNRVIVLEGPLRMLTLAISNITYLPDPNYNTRVPGNSEEIVLEINDAGALGDSLKNAAGKLVPPPSVKGKKVINVNIESVNDAPIIGRRIALECNEKYANRKMNCPLGANDPNAKNLERIESWSQVRNWPGKNIMIETLFTSFKKSVDYIDVDEVVTQTFCNLI